MPIVVPNNGEEDGLAYFVNKTQPQDLVLRLFTNNVVPSETDTAATYTEPTGNGYGAITLVGANWTVTEGAPSEAVYAQQTFTFTGAAGNVYGYFLTRASSGRIAYAERFSDAPYSIQANGDQVKITPRLTLD